MSVFFCLNCSNEYNDNDRRPLSLPCGDVFCEQCIHNIYNIELNNIICPSDKKIHNIELNKIPICAQILSNLPSNSISTNANSSEFINCNKHLSNKLQFYCEDDKIYLCKYCLVEHLNHNYKEIFINKEIFKNEISDIKNYLLSAKDNYINYKKKIDENVYLIKEHFDKQIYNINEYFDNFISILHEKKSKFISKIMQINNEYNKKLANIKQYIYSSDKTLTEFNNKINIFENEFFPKGNYEIFVNNKKILIDEINLFKEENTKYLNIDFNKCYIPEYIKPTKGVFLLNEMNKDDNINNNDFGHIDQIILNKNIFKSSLDKLIITNNNNINKNINYGININKINKNEDNNSVIDNKFVETSSTFFILNKNDVKNVFKQQQDSTEYLKQNLEVLNEGTYYNEIFYTQVDDNNKNDLIYSNKNKLLKSENHNSTKNINNLKISNANNNSTKKLKSQNDAFLKKQNNYNKIKNEINNNRLSEISSRLKEKQFVNEHIDTSFMNKDNPSFYIQLSTNESKVFNKENNKKQNKDNKIINNNITIKRSGSTYNKKIVQKKVIDLSNSKNNKNTSNNKNKKNEFNNLNISHNISEIKNILTSLNHQDKYILNNNKVNTNRKDKFENHIILQSEGNTSFNNHININQCNLNNKVFKTKINKLPNNSHLITNELKINLINNKQIPLPHKNFFSPGKANSPQDQVIISNGAQNVYKPSPNLNIHHLNSSSNINGIDKKISKSSKKKNHLCECNSDNNIFI